MCWPSSGAGPRTFASQGTNHQGLGALQDGEHVDVEISGIGRISFDVTDPLKRSWPKGIDPDPGERVRANVLKHHEEVMSKN